METEKSLPEIRPDRPESPRAISVAHGVGRLAARKPAQNDEEGQKKKMEPEWR